MKLTGNEKITQGEVTLDFSILDFWKLDIV